MKKLSYGVHNSKKSFIFCFEIMKPPLKFLNFKSSKSEKSRNNSLENNFVYLTNYLQAIKTLNLPSTFHKSTY